MAVGEIARTTGLLPPTLPTPAPTRPDPGTPTWLELGQIDETARFLTLTSDLSRTFDTDGDGKRITSGHAYAGVPTAVAWASVCRDLSSGAPRQSIESFAERWRGIRASAPAEPSHYVSLGPGDGRKDGVLLEDLSRTNRDLCYLPVDASSELLHLAVRHLVRRMNLPTDRILSLPWDFTMRESVGAIRQLLDELFGATPVLFSLLGNTIANFDADADLLGLFATKLLRPQDRLLLEVEATTALGAALAEAAVAEYADSPAFGDFVTSALRHHTDVDAGRDDIETVAAPEADRALLVKTTYRNRAGQDFLTLPNRAGVPLAPDDTIRLALSRKYTAAGLATMLAEAGLTITADSCTGTGGPFGLALLMLAPTPVENS